MRRAGPNSPRKAARQRGARVHALPIAREALSAALRDTSLLPPGGANALNMEDSAGVSALVAGQSLRFAAGEGEAGLYLSGLPLCRLRARGGGAFI